jgi:hypothetical protein
MGSPAYRLLDDLVNHLQMAMSKKIFLEAVRMETSGEVKGFRYASYARLVA